MVLGIVQAPRLGAVRAAASGLSAIEVVDRPARSCEPHEIKRVVVDGPQIATPRTVEEWVRLLEELAARLDRGTIYHVNCQPCAQRSPPWSTPSIADGADARR